MLCVKCGRDAAQFQVIRDGDGEHRLALCPDCFRALSGRGEEPAPKAEKTCPACGTSFSEYRATGLVGCAYCYTAFREELLPVIRKLQGKTVHAGKRPSAAAMEKYDRTRGLIGRRDIINKKIAKAESEGDYEAVKALKAELRRVLLSLAGGDA